MQKVRENYVHILYNIAKSDLLNQILTEMTGKKVKLTYKDMDIHNHIKSAEYMLS